MYPPSPPRLSPMSRSRCPGARLLARKQTLALRQTAPPPPRRQFLRVTLMAGGSTDTVVATPTICRELAKPRGGGTHRTSVSPPFHPTEVLPGPSPCLGAPEGKLRHGAGGAHPGETPPAHGGEGWGVPGVPPPSPRAHGGGLGRVFGGGSQECPQGSPQQHGRPLRPHGQVQQPVAVQVEAGVEAAPEISQPPPPAQRRRLDALRGEARAAPAVASPLARIGLCRHRGGIGERFWGGGTPKLSPGMDRAPPSHPLPNFSPACSGAGGCRGRRGRRRRRRGGRPPGGPPPGRR